MTADARATSATDALGPSNTVTCSVRRLAGVTCLAVSGELDMAGVASFSGHLTSAGGAVVVDLSGLRYIDSSGINALLTAQRRFSATGQRIALAAVSPSIRRIFQIIALEQVIPVFPTVEVAVTRLNGGGHNGKNSDV